MLQHCFWVPGCYQAAAHTCENRAGCEKEAGEQVDSRAVGEACAASVAHVSVPSPIEAETACTAQVSVL